MTNKEVNEKLVEKFAVEVNDYLKKAKNKNNKKHG